MNILKAFAFISLLKKKPKNQKKTKKKAKNKKTNNLLRCFIDCEYIKSQ